MTQALVKKQHFEEVAKFETDKYKLVIKFEDAINVRDNPRSNPRVFRLLAERNIAGIIKVGDLGGVISSPHNLSSTGDCWISYSGEVTEDARVSDNAYVDHAKISGCAIVRGNAKVGHRGRNIFSRPILIEDDVVIEDEAEIIDSPHIFGKAHISKSAKAGGHSKVYGYAVLTDSSSVGGNAHVRGHARLTDNGRVYNNAFVEQDRKHPEAYTIVDGFAHVCDGAAVHRASHITDHALIGGKSKIVETYVGRDRKIIDRLLINNRRFPLHMLVF